MFFKKSEDKIIFYAEHDGMEKEKDIVPYPAKKYLPSWWTSVPNQHNNWPTLRRCPAIPDFFTQGYILPMWRDIRISGVDKDKNVKFDLDPSDPFNSKFRSLNGHSSYQFLDHYDFRIGDRDIESTLKFDSPWYVITPKGWSTLVLPLFYEFNQNYTLLPGIVDTDIFHQMNHPALLHSNGKTFMIQKGQPFLMYIPFKRTKLNYKILKTNIDTQMKLKDIEDDWTSKQELHLGMGFGFKNAYRKIQKERHNK